MTKLLNDRQVADVLGVSVTTVRRLRYAGELPTVRVRGQARVTETAVVAYIEKNTAS